jgi:hypothetical protein
VVRKCIRYLRKLTSSLKLEGQIRLRGITGQDYQENIKLKQLLYALQTDYNRLTDEMSDLVYYTDGEIQKVKHHNEQLFAHNETLQTQNDQFQLRIWDLETENDQYLSRIGELEQELDDWLEKVTNFDEFFAHAVAIATPSLKKPTSPPPVAELLPDLPDHSLDLSGFHLALVGGHSNIRRAVTTELSERYSLQNWVEVPPFSHGHLGRSRIKSKIQHCDLVVMITRYMNHSLSDSIYSLKAAGALSGDILHLDCRGKTGIIRQILDYYQKHNGAALCNA